MFLLIFSLVRTAFLSGIFLLIFSLVRTAFLSCHTKFEKRKVLKKDINLELMPVAWHPNRRWDWFMPEDEEKKKNRSNAYWGAIKCVLVAYKMGVLDSMLIEEL